MPGAALLTSHGVSVRVVPARVLTHGKMAALPPGANAAVPCVVRYACACASAYACAGRALAAQGWAPPTSRLQGAEGMAARRTGTPRASPCPLGENGRLAQRADAKGWTALC